MLPDGDALAVVFLSLQRTLYRLTSTSIRSTLIAITNWTLWQWERHTHLTRCGETRGCVVKVKSYYNTVTWLSRRSPQHNPACCRRGARLTGRVYFLQERRCEKAQESVSLKSLLTVCYFAGLSEYRVWNIKPHNASLAVVMVTNPAV